MKKIKISELPLYQSLVGLFTIGTDAQNRSVKVSLEFIETKTNQAVTNAQTATSNAVAATEQAEAAKQAALEAAGAATSAAGAANDAAGAANDAAATALNAAGTADRARQNAETATSEAQTATTDANNAKDAANTAAAAANTAKQDADTAASNATSTANAAAAYAREEADAAVLEVRNTMGIFVPTGMSVEAPERLTVGNTYKPLIKVTLQPSTAMKNVIYMSDNEAVKVSPDGKITVLRTGVSEIHVIPTCNTALFKTVQVRVTEPTLRLVNTRRIMRFTSSGAMRLN